MTERDPLGLAAMRERNERAADIYAALRTTGQLSTLKSLTYRCALARCALLHVVDTPEGLLVGFPRYKTSPAVTAASSNEEGRRANTEDGQGKWKQHAAFGEYVSNPPLACDHLHNVPLSDDAIREDRSRGHTEVLVRSDGSRYPVS